MSDPVSHRCKLAADAVTAAFILVARHSVSSGTMDMIELNRRLTDLKEGNGGGLRRVLQSLDSLAVSPEFATFRLVTAALAQSLPRICATQVSARDLRLAALDLRKLEKEAVSLRAPDVAARLVGIIDALLEQVGPAELQANRPQLH
jgi:hypothetical protein